MKITKQLELNFNAEFGHVVLSRIFNGTGKSWNHSINSMLE